MGCNINCFGCNFWLVDFLGVAFDNTDVSVTVEIDRAEFM